MYQLILPNILESLTDEQLLLNKKIIQIKMRLTRAYNTKVGMLKH